MIIWFLLTFFLGGFVGFAAAVWASEVPHTEEPREYQEYGDE
jgi:hypothetical protein